MSKQKKKNKTKGHWEVELLISFKDIYPDLTPLDIVATLSQISRDKIFKWVKILLSNSNGFEKLTRSKHLSLCSPFIDGFNRRCQKFTLEKRGFPYKYSFVSILTELELLRYIFSITNSKWKLFRSTNRESFIKIILLVNEEITQRNGGDMEIKNRPDLEKRLFAMLFSQGDIVNFNPNETFRDQLIHFVYFKEFIETNEEFKSICDIFLKMLGIDSLYTYFKQIFLLWTKFGVVGKRYLSHNEIPNGVTESVLDYISIPYDQNVPLDSNSDYKAFRDKPLIKMPDGGYLLTYERFLLEKIFYCLQFDFAKIQEERGKKWDNSVYTFEYMEKYFLYRLLREINSTNIYFAKSGVECGKRGYDGEPDYYLKSKETGNIILFENKSVLINSGTKQEGNYDEITEVWEKKALSKPRDGKDGHKVVGVGQLIRNIRRVINNDVFWDNDISGSAKIYPVLVLSDIRQVSAEHTNMFQEMFAKECQKHQIPLRRVGHLILMPITTLKLYENEFQNRGLECYFECYYKKLKRSQSVSGDLHFYQTLVSFPEFMGKHFTNNREIVHQDLISRLQMRL